MSFIMQYEELKQRFEQERNNHDLLVNFMSHIYYLDRWLEESSNHVRCSLTLEDTIELNQWFHDATLLYFKIKKQKQRHALFSWIEATWEALCEELIFLDDFPEEERTSSPKRKPVRSLKEPLSLDSKKKKTYEHSDAEKEKTTRYKDLTFKPSESIHESIQTTEDRMQATLSELENPVAATPVSSPSLRVIASQSQPCTVDSNPVDAPFYRG